MTKKKLINILKLFYSETSTMPTLIATGKRIPNYKRVMIPLRDKYSIPLITWDNVPKYLKEEEKKIEEGDKSTTEKAS